MEFVAYPDVSNSDLLSALFHEGHMESGREFLVSRSFDSSINGREMFQTLSDFSDDSWGMQASVFLESWMIVCESEELDLSASFTVHSNSVWVNLSTHTYEDAERFMENVEEGLPPVGDAEDLDKIDVRFWMLGGSSPTSQVRTLETFHWDDVKRNYPGQIKAQLDDLMKMPAPAVGGKLILWHGHPGGGKGLSLDTPMPTPTGWSKMGDLEVGDTLFGPDGKPVNVSFVSEVHNRPCFKVSFSDGSSLTADDEHQWHIYTAYDRATRRTTSPEWRRRRREGRLDVKSRNSLGAYEDRSGSASQGRVVSTVDLAELIASEGKRVAIGVAAPIELPEADLPLNPYILGLWLGDGTSSGGGFSTADQEVVNAFKEDGWDPHQSPGATYDYRTYGLTSRLRELGVLNNKHIPEEYFRSSANQRLALLQGLMDSDGCSTLTGAVEFTSTLKPLATGVQQLMISLGARASLQEGQRATLYGMDCGERFRVKATPRFPAFRLDRKLERQNLEPTDRVNWRYVTAVEPVESVPTKCIQVDNESRCYLAGENWVTTHNTSAIKTLVDSWRGWANAEYVVDPESFFGHASYMLSVLNRGTTNGLSTETDDWRLIIVEDAGQFVHKDADATTGQAFSRLLNMTDGMIGQGLKVIVLITTNRPLEEMHEALRRPGRCIANIEFSKFSAREASEWLGSPASAEMSLAELYEAQKVTQIQTKKETASTGQYI